MSPESYASSRKLASWHGVAQHQGHLHEAGGTHGWLRCLLQILGSWALRRSAYQLLEWESQADMVNWQGGNRIPTKTQTEGKTDRIQSMPSEPKEISETDGVGSTALVLKAQAEG